MAKYDLHIVETREPNTTKFDTIGYVRERTPQTKFGSNTFYPLISLQVRRVDGFLAQKT